jgi:hypothetical protein
VAASAGMMVDTTSNDVNVEFSSSLSMAGGRQSE